MKKAILLMLIVTAAMTSCKKDNSTNTPGSGTGNDLPQKAVTYITDNYPDATIDYYVAFSGGSADYLVTLTTSEELAFDNHGNYLGMGRYHHGGGHGDTIHCDTIHGGHHGGGIPADSLPASIVSYVSTNYPGYILQHARYDSLCSEGLVIGIMLTQTDSLKLKLYFDVTGNFLISATRLLYADLPQAVRDYISAHYSDFDVCNKAERLLPATGSSQYIVYLHRGEMRKSIRVDESGSFVCEQTEAPTGGGHHEGGHHGGGHH